VSKRNFCLLQILIAVTLIFGLLVNTYAWADRGEASGSKLSLNYSASVNGSKATAQTTFLDGNAVLEGKFSRTVSAGDVLHFETVIDNIDNADENAVTSNVSLFLEALSFIGDSGSSNVRQGDVLFTVALVRQIAGDADQQTENKSAREYFELRVTNDGTAVEGAKFARILSSYEIGAGDTETFAWSIEFEYGGTFEFDSVVLEHF
jgi:hypothetical protein